MTSRTGPVRRLFRWCWIDIRSGETPDLWLLVFASSAFTILGATGIASVQVLSSFVLGLLALLAISQIRGRQEVRGLVASWRQSRTALFEDAFPDAYYQARAVATHSYAFAGLTMSRTLPTMRPDFVRILENQGSVRVLLPDPDNRELMEMVAASRRYGESAADTETTVRQSIAVAKSIGGASGSAVEVRLTSLLPRVGLNLIDAGKPDGLAMAQMYQTHPSEEAAPIFVLRTTDDPWFDHFCSEFEKLWDRAAAC